MYHVTMVAGAQSVKGHIFISDILAIAVVSGTELLWDKHLSLRRPQYIMYNVHSEPLQFKSDSISNCNSKEK